MSRKCVPLRNAPLHILLFRAVSLLLQLNQCPALINRENYVLLNMKIITARKPSLGQGNVLHASVILFTGGGGWLSSMHHRSHDQRRGGGGVCLRGGLHPGGSASGGGVEQNPRRPRT